MKLEDLVGKTITAVQRLHKPRYDDLGWVQLQFSDGTHCVLSGGDGGYTGGSEHDGQARLEILEDEKELAELVPYVAKPCGCFKTYPHICGECRGDVPYGEPCPCDCHKKA